VGFTVAESANLGSELAVSALPAGLRGSGTVSVSELPVRLGPSVGRLLVVVRGAIVVAVGTIIVPATGGVTAVVRDSGDASPLFVAAKGSPPALPYSTCTSWLGVVTSIDWVLLVTSGGTASVKSAIYLFSTFYNLFIF
jgi:hypothetical protein